MTITPQVPPPCDLTLGMTCLDKLKPGTSKWHMRVSERFLNPVGVMQGGFVCAFVDSAMGASVMTYANQMNPELKLKAANAELKISLIRPIFKDVDIYCDATVLSGGRKVVFVEATVTDESGKLFAKASSTYLVLER